MVITPLYYKDKTTALGGNVIITTDLEFVMPELSWWTTFTRLGEANSMEDSKESTEQTTGFETT